MHIIHVITNKVWGGGEQYALTAAKVARAAGHTVTAIVRASSTAVIRRFRDEGFTVVTAPFTLTGTLTTRRILRSAAKDAAEQCTSGRPIVHVHNFKDARKVLSANTGAAIVCSRHLARHGKPKDLKTYRALDALLFVSASSRDTFLAGLAPGHGLNPVVVDAAVDGPAEDVPEPADGMFHVAYMGRIHPEKGLDSLIDAMAYSRPDVILNIYGSGDSKYMDQLKARAAEVAPARIIFHGSAPSPYPAFQHANMGIIPSIAPEAFGLVAAECMSCARACAVSNLGALPYVVPDGSPTFIPGDPQDMAMAIDCLAADPAARAALGRAGRVKWRAQYAPEIFAEKILSLYKSTL